MNISVKGEYALEAVFDLATQPYGEPIKIADIAKRQKIPQKFLELILGSLALRGETGRAAGFGLALFGFCFSMYLTYRELFTIHAICQWCVSSAVVMTIVVVLTLFRWLLYAEEVEPTRARATPVESR